MYNAPNAPMIYLAIDTDVWLYLAIVGYDKEHNLFDELYYWLELGDVRCIVPSHIIFEWERNKEAKITNIKTLIATSVGQLQQTDAIQDRKLFNKVFNSDIFEATARSRVNKIDYIFKRFADIAPVTDSVKLEAGERTLMRLAPSHKKDSYSDAVNILSILNYIRENALTGVVFTTKNFTDYSSVSDKYKLHPDLHPLFTEVDLKYAHNVDELFNKVLRPQLASFSENLRLKKAEQEAHNLMTAQLQREQLSNPDEDFIGNVSMLDQILAQSRPTQFQFKTVLELIDSDENCREHFFRNVDKPVWLSFMEEQGFLDPATHPKPLDTPHGSAASRWPVLNYLERLSQQLNSGVHPELTSTLLELINRISVARVDNDLTHTKLVRILSNLPNTAINFNVLERLPDWFSIHTNKMFPSTAVLDQLLPKFIHEEANEEDIAKGEKILSYLLGISRKGIEIDTTPERLDTSFYPNSYPWSLAETLIRKDLILLVAKRCSTTLFLTFARTVKLLLLDYPKGLRLPINKNGAEYVIKVDVTLPDLYFSLTLPGHTDEFSRTIITDFEGLNEIELRSAIIEALKILGLEYEPSDQNGQALRGLLSALTVDLLSTAGATAIAQMNIDRSHSKHFRSLYAIILVKYLSAITEAKPEDALTISATLYYDKSYKLPFFKRIVLHNLSQHFELQRNLFHKILSRTDPDSLFTEYIYRTDLFNLLRDNQKRFNTEEIELLRTIIDGGPPDEEDANRIAYWKSRWYLAVNEVEPFNELYGDLAQRFDLRDSDVDPNQTVRFRSGTIPPITTDELLAMTDDNLVSYILTFEPEDLWEGPNIQGLAEAFKEGVKRQPMRFLAMSQFLLPLPYIYAYHLLYALLEIGRKDKADLDWGATIHFCQNYVQQVDFDTNNRKLAADNWQADKNWVMGVVAYLISDISRHDEIVAVEKLLPNCEATLLIINTYSTISNTEEPQHRDYITHSFNSDNGKFLRACMDYCLCANRLTHRENPNFQPAFRDIFDTYLIRGAIDAFVIIGYYWQQFNYLDHKWLMQKIKRINKVSFSSWQAFMGGFLFGPAPGTSDLLNTIIPYYRKAIAQKMEMKITGTNGFAVQIASLYLWGKLDLSMDGILTQYLTTMPISSVKDVLHILFFSPSYYEELNYDEFMVVEDKLIALIDFLYQQYADVDSDADVIEMKRSAINIIHTIRKLTDSNTRIISLAVAMANKQYHHDDLYERLNELIKVGEPLITAGYIALILEQMTFNEHMHLLPDDTNNLSSLIQFLYDNGQNIMADKLCNRLTRAGQSFAKALYQKNSS